MISVLTTDLELEALRPEWETLWEVTPKASAFQSPHWLLPWWHHFGTGLPRIVVNRQDGCLTGVLPLYVLPNEEKLLPIGAGVTDYLDALGDGTGLLEAALVTVEVRSCDLMDIQPSSSLVHATPALWNVEWREGTACPVLELPHIRKLAKRKLNMSRNRADRAGDWQIGTADPTTLAHHLSTLMRLHQQHWARRGEPGVMADPRLRAFWREAAPSLLAAGLLRLQTLSVAGREVAAIAALLAPGRILFYLGGFDDAHAFISPGTILLGAMLEQAIGEGRSEAHFLRGGERYKYTWGAKDRFNWSGRLTPSNVQR